MVTTRGTVWGDIIVTKEYFAFFAFGLNLGELEETEDYLYVERFDVMSIKKEFIFKWTEIEEVFFTKFLNKF